MENLRPLTDSERQQAWNRARDRIAGYEPLRQQFVNSTGSKYPVYITRLITVLCIIVLISAFLPSAIRLFDIGRSTFYSAIPDSASAVMVGISTIVLAEIGQVVSTLALAVLSASRFSRITLIISAGIFTAIALIGNVELAKPYTHSSLFGYLESIAPPILVLSMAYLLKEQFLESIAQRQNDLLMYLQAHQEYKVRFTTPENDPKWIPTYANALRDQLRGLYSRTGSTKEVVPTLTNRDWFTLIQREFNADKWYIDTGVTIELEKPVIETVSENEPVQRLPPSERKYTIVNPDGTYTAICPVCETTIGSRYKDRHTASVARSNHRRKMHPPRS